MSPDPFRQALRDLGWVEGQNLTIELRDAEGRSERLPALAEDLVRAGVELIYAPVGSTAIAAQQATSAIPIVFATAADPVGQGLVVSLARPGGNLTGLSSSNSELMAKRVQLLKEVVPGATRLAVLHNDQLAGQPMYESIRRSAEAGARAAGLQIRFVDESGPAPAQLADAFSNVVAGQPDVLLVVPTPVFTPFQRQLGELAAMNRLPAISDDLSFVRAGLLLSYGANYDDLQTRAASFADRILKGANPADLPVEQPTKFDFGINLQTARAIGLTIPQGVLAQATEVIQ